MSLARAAGAVVGPSKRAGTTLLQRRAASSHAHDEHHHEEYHDTNVYEPEGASGITFTKYLLFTDFLSFNLLVFNTPFWRRAAIAAVGIVAFYKYAPAPGDENPIAKYISSTMTPAKVYQDVSFKHLIGSAQISDDTKLMVDAKPPVVHRYRYPQCVQLL